MNEIAQNKSTTHPRLTQFPPFSSLVFFSLTDDHRLLSLPHLHHHRNHYPFRDGRVILKSNSTSAEYATPQRKFGWRKVKTCWFGSTKWFWPLYSFVEVGKRHSTVLQSLTPAGDWLDSLIARGGLPLIVSQLFAILVFILCVGLEKDK